MVEWIPENQTSLRPMSRRLAFRGRCGDGGVQVGPGTQSGTIRVLRLLKAVVGLGSIHNFALRLRVVLAA